MLTREMLRLGLPELYTRRVRLRQLRTEDYPALERILSDPLVIQYVNRIRKPVYTRMRRLVAQIKISSDSLDSLHFAVEWHPRNTGESNLLSESNELTSSPLLGIVSFQQWNERTGEAQLGYILDRPFWGQGLATEVVGEMLNFGFRSLKLKRIESRCQEDNQASMRVLIKNKMRLLRTIGAYDPSGVVPSVLVFSMTQGDYA
ncbi:MULTISPECIES: GNAT family N-acetyltransferase [Paenibacillus]|uniref:GNAT family N-acetyltransferase n=1 Tax=Paenibacillus peoriae TaxID=59893 RepID=A0A7H0Y6C9_9BACL|nr:MULTISPECIES: GNAT family N-acetyltransferase [Paenibacillus]KOS01218.1 acetyltransferase [Paenibacillus polymyxa]QNR66637.1 GNAT family N-acetyltransferase [Paenibacillus peoriae]URJ59440.1 GNAT family N-acetyltransferase [Paenibacillus polymyxa]